MEPLSFWSWKGNCGKCGKPTKAPKDLFCANYGASRGSWLVCRRSWCGSCYEAPKNLDFQIARPENDKGSKWKKKKDEARFLNARNGDMLCSPFQCDTCWFVNLNKREPQSLSHSDERLMGYIRRVNLDLMWSREQGTVANTLAAVSKGRTMSVELGMVPQPIKLGPWPLADNQGFQTAIEMLRASQKKGKNDKSYVQFDTVRKIRTAYSTIYENSASAGLHTGTFKGAHGNTFAVNHGSTDTRLFRKIR